MRTAPFRYSKAETVAQAVKQLQDNGQALAGGQSLLQVMKLRMSAPEHLVDIQGVKELEGITYDDDGTVTIGSMTRYSQLENSPGLLARYPWFVEAVSKIGDTQVRNRGTIGGNLCFADPRANLPPVLISLGAQVVVEGPSGRKTINVTDLFVDFRKNSLNMGELLVAIKIPPWPQDARGKYLEIARQPNGVPMVNAAVTVAGNPVQRVGVAVGGVAPTPLQLYGVEERLLGRPLTPETIEDAVSAIDAEPLKPLDDMHASAAYRGHVVRVLVRRALQAVSEGAAA